MSPITAAAASGVRRPSISMSPAPSSVSVKNQESATVGW